MHEKPFHVKVGELSWCEYEGRNLLPSRMYIEAQKERITLGCAHETEITAMEMVQFLTKHGIENVSVVTGKCDALWRKK